MEGFKFLLQSLWCVCPFISYELYYICFNRIITDDLWPRIIDNNDSVANTKIIIQVNGRYFSEIITNNLSIDYILPLAKEKYSKPYTDYKYINNKVLNFIT